MERDQTFGTNDRVTTSQKGTAVPNGASMMTEDLSRRRMLRLMLGTGVAVAAGGLTVARSLASSTGYYRTTDRLNLRSGAGANYGVLTVIPARSLVTDQGESRNGYRKVTYQGMLGWAHLDWLTVENGPSPGPTPVIIGTATTTASVNLRSGPSTGNRVLRVVAAGTRVQFSDTVQNSFRYVIHNGQAGWMADAYLRRGGDGPVPGTLTVTARLNLRTTASTSARVLLVLPEGAHVRPTGGGANNFSEVIYGNTRGWAYNDYLE